MSKINIVSRIDVLELLRDVFSTFFENTDKGKVYISHRDIYNLINIIEDKLTVAYRSQNDE